MKKQDTSLRELSVTDNFKKKTLKPRSHHQGCLFSDVEALLEDHGSFALERAIYEWRALVLPLPSAFQLANRQRPVSCLTFCRCLCLARICSGSDADVIELDDILALAAAVHLPIELDPAWPQQRYPRTLPELLTGVAELLTRHQPDDVPVLHDASTIQKITRVEFRILELLEFELVTLTPTA